MRERRRRDPAAPHARVDLILQAGQNDATELSL